MLESLQNDSVYWIMAFALIALIFTLFGRLTGGDLSERARKMRVRKFALIGAALFFFAVPIFKPMVYSTSGTKYLDEIKVEEFSTPDNLAKLVKMQTRQIEVLKEDVLELRRDMRRLHQFYSTLFQLFASLAAMLCLIYAFKNDENPLKNDSE